MTRVVHRPTARTPSRQPQRARVPAERAPRRALLREVPVRARAGTQGQHDVRRPAGSRVSLRSPGTREPGLPLRQQKHCRPNRVMPWSALAAGALQLREHRMPAVSRRFLLAGAALGAASLLVPITGRPVRAAARNDADYEITDWIVIAASGEVTLALSQPEVGQGSYTALPQILAEELDADWARVKVRFVTGRAAYKIAFRQEPPVQKEGASVPTTALYERLRTAGAAARDALVRAAARRWKIDPSRCRTENGKVIGPRGQTLSYRAPAAAAAQLPLAARPPLKDRRRFGVI